MAIDAGGLSAELYCGQCRAVRVVSPAPAAGYWAYCGRCGGLLVGAGARRRYAGFWRRFAGYWIDLAVIASIYISAIGGLALLGASGETAYSLGVSMAAPLHFLYLWVFNARGATIGKVIVRVRVVDYTGNPPGLKRSAKRYLMSLVSDLALRAGYFAMIGDQDKQTWHDEFGGTYVVRR